MINFKNTSALAGFDARHGQQYGLAWGDFNGDNLPDLYLSEHAWVPPRLYQNLGDGSFEDKTDLLILPPSPVPRLIGQEQEDKHGAAWADFDNDGDQDLFQAVGLPEDDNHPDGWRSRNIFFINNENLLDGRRTSELNVTHTAGRSQAQTWLDFDRDGLLDLFVAARPRSRFNRLQAGLPPTIYRQTDNGFVDTRSDAFPGLTSSVSAVHSDINGDGNLDLLVLGSTDNKLSKGRVIAYDLTSLPFKEIPLGELNNVVFDASGHDGSTGYDPIVADFNGDLLPDVYLSGAKNLGKRVFPNRFFINTGSGFVERTKEAGLQLNSSATGAVAGDFDNDMDLDLYVVNNLYENQGNGTFKRIPNAGNAIVDYKEETARGVTTVDYNLDGALDLFIMAKQLGGDPGLLFTNQVNENNWLAIDLEGVTSNRDGIGASVFVTAGGVKQLREQSAGIHKTVQNHSRLHFGLGNNQIVEEIEVHWPNGTIQTIENIPANQQIRIVEPSGSFVPGQPDFQMGEETGVFLWKEYFDGPYHLRTVGDGGPIEFDINLIANDSLLEVNPVLLEGGDVLDVTDFGFSLTSLLRRGEDGVDFHLRPGTEAFLSVTQDGVANPRQVNIGQQRERISPTGWIVSSDEISELPTFSPGNDMGLFFGRGGKNNSVQFRWAGDQNRHQSSISVLAADKNTKFLPVRLEPNDEVETFSNGVKIQGIVRNSDDGLNVATTEPTNLAIAYDHDGLFQSHRVNTSDNLLGFPNAYQLPLANPYGQPEYDLLSVDEAIYVWLDEEDVWHLRVTGDEDGSRYIGSIVSDQPVVDIQTVSVEPSDLVNTADPLKIDFDFKVGRQWEDGLDFRFPKGTSLTLNMEHLTLNLEQTDKEAASLLHVGAEQWAVRELPLDLSGWS